MARWARPEGDVPLEVAAYDPAIHGPGEDAIRAWGAAAMEWVRADPERAQYRLPGDPVGIIKTKVALFEELRRQRYEASRRKAG